MTHEEWFIKYYDTFDDVPIARSGYEWYLDISPPQHLQSNKPPWDTGTMFESIFTQSGGHILFGSGCTHNDCNYTEICTSITTLFESWATLWNCLTLSTIAVKTRMEISYEGRVNATEDRAALQEVIGEALRPLDLKLDYAENFDYMAVFNLTFDCAQASCQGWKGDGSCSLVYPDPEELKPVTNEWERSTLLEAFGDALGSFCVDVPTNNPDLAGPGVFISHVAQVMMTMMIWLCFRLIFLKGSLEFFTKSHNSSNKNRGETPRDSLQAHCPRLRALLERAERSHMTQSTVTFLVDLHEAHCFFLIGLQLAGLIVTFGHISWLGTFTFYSLPISQATIDSLATYGLYSMLLNQITLRRLRIGSTYSLVLGTLVAGFVTAAQHLSFSEDFIMNKVTPNYPSVVSECGNMMSLRLHCFGDGASLSNVKPFYYSRSLQYGITASILVTLWLSKLFENASHSYVENIRWLIPLTKWRNNLPSTIASKSVSVFLVLCELYFVMYLLWNTTYTFPDIRELAGVYYQEEVGTWNVGQVLALLVWVPVLSKYCYILIAGIEEGFRIRLSDLFVVRRRDKLHPSDDALLPSSAVLGTTPEDSLSQENSPEDEEKLVAGTLQQTFAHGSSTTIHVPSSPRPRRRAMSI